MNSSITLSWGRVGALAARATVRGRVSATSVLVAACVGESTESITSVLVAARSVWGSNQSVAWYWNRGGSRWLRGVALSRCGMAVFTSGSTVRNRAATTPVLVTASVGEASKLVAGKLVSAGSVWGGDQTAWVWSWGWDGAGGRWWRCAVTLTRGGVGGLATRSAVISGGATATVLVAAAVASE